tara:strand:+ start:317 stop:1126 length:810 start_codon:yes stop_codon:yes gene_type:complete
MSIIIGFAMLVYPNIDPIIFSLGPLHIRWYSLAYIAGILLPFLIFKQAYRHSLKMSMDDIFNYISYLILGVIIGGRIGYVLFYDFIEFMKSPHLIIAIWRGGMSYHGGAIGAIISTILFAKRYHINKLMLLDLLAIGSTIGIFLGRIANFINGELFGRVTTSPLGMVFPMGGHLPRHPSQLYESFAEGFLLFLILWIIRRYLTPKPGILGSIYLILYGSFRFVLEFFREPDAHLGFVIHIFSLGQLLCIVEILIGLYLCWLLQKQPTHH